MLKVKVKIKIKSNAVGASGIKSFDFGIQIKSHNLQAVDTFTYLGSTLSRDTQLDAEVNCRISNASSMFGRLRSKVWERRGISLPTKLKVYRAVVISILLYASETWTVYRRHAKQLNQFHMTCLRRIFNTQWQDKVPDTDILSKAKIPSIFTLLQRNQARSAAHICRMSDERIPKQLLYGQLASGKRYVGGQKKRFK